MLCVVSLCVFWWGRLDGLRRTLVPGPKKNGGRTAYFLPPPWPAQANKPGVQDSVAPDEYLGYGGVLSVLGAVGVVWAEDQVVVYPGPPGHAGAVADGHAHGLYWKAPVAAGHGEPEVPAGKERKMAHTGVAAVAATAAV